MNEYVMRIPLRDRTQAQAFSALIGAYVAAQEKTAHEASQWLGVRTEMRDGQKIKCMIFESRDHFLSFLAFWRAAKIWR